MHCTMMQASNRAVSRRIPTAAEWDGLRRRITELYHNHRWSLAKIVHYLTSKGHRVNERMLRARISQWDLQKNHQTRDMVAALRLLDPDPAMWPTREPRFLIRGRLVTMQEILHFFKRKGISNPFQWVWSYTIGQPNSTVVLVQTEPSSVTVDDRLDTSPASDRRHGRVSGGCNLQTIQTQEEKAVASLHAYCSAYLGSGGVFAHQEKLVHRSTTYGQFGGHMQEGLARILRKDPDAMSEIDQGFDSVNALLKDCHPMALAQILTVSCNLATRGAQSMSVSLLEHTISMASELHMSGPEVQLLSALRASQNILPVVIASLRAALGAFAGVSQPCWQKLYIQERLCDCLSLCNERDESSSHRVSLYVSQEQFYGPNSRNVLRTLCHVARDQLRYGNLEAAKENFTLVLTRAGYMMESGQVETRFVALEGLARVEQRCAEELSRKSPNMSHTAVISYIRAFHHIDDALSIAQPSFEPKSQRLSRARDQKWHILNHLTRVNQQSLPPELRDILKNALRIVPNLDD